MSLSCGPGADVGRRDVADVRHVEAEQRPELGLGELRLRDPREPVLAQPVEAHPLLPVDAHRSVCGQSHRHPPQSFAESVTGRRVARRSLDDGPRHWLGYRRCKRLQTGHRDDRETSMEDGDLGRAARLDRHRPDGLQPGQPPARGGLRRRRLQPHAGQGRAAGRARGDASSTRRRSSPTARSSSPWSPAPTTSSRSSSARRACSPTPGRAPEDHRRLDHRLARGVGRRCAARLAERDVALLAAPVSGNPKVVDAGLLTIVVSGPARRLRGGRALSSSSSARAPPTSARASAPGWRRSATT